MAVAIVPKFTKAQITQLLQQRRQRVQDAVLSMLKRTGEQFVTNARENANFKDRTGNLRSSMGYVVLYNGQQISNDFKTVSGGKEGKQIAKEVIDAIKKEFPRGFVLIGVAGMDYAAAVEAKGYDVITASSTTAEETLKSAVKQIRDKIGKIT